MEIKIIGLAMAFVLLILLCSCGADETEVTGEIGGTRESMTGSEKSQALSGDATTSEISPETESEAASQSKSSKSSKASASSGKSSSSSSSSSKTTDAASSNSGIINRNIDESFCFKKCSDCLEYYDDDAMNKYQSISCVEISIEYEYIQNGELLQPNNFPDVDIHHITAYNPLDEPNTDVFYIYLNKHGEKEILEAEQLLKKYPFIKSAKRVLFMYAD